MARWCLVALFVLVEQRAAEPVIPLRLFRSRDLLAVEPCIGFVVGFAMFGAITFLPLFLQIVRRRLGDGLGPAAAAADGGRAGDVDRQPGS